MKLMRVLLAAFLLAAFLTGYRVTEDVGTEEKIYYFYEEICAACDARKEFFDLVRDCTQGITLPENYSVDCYNVFTDKKDTFSRVCDEKNIPEEERRLPMVITSAGFAAGEENIRRQLRQLICDHYGLAGNYSKP